MSSLDLASLEFGDEGIIEQINLPSEDAQRLMELGFLPGVLVSVKRGSPLGHSRVFLVAGSEFALRYETASKIIVQKNDTLKENE